VRAATAYRHDRLVVDPSDPDVAERARTLLAEIASGHGLTLHHTEEGVVGFRGDTANGGVDAWTVLSALQSDPELARIVGLDHLLSTAEQPGGNPFAIGHGRPGLDGYGAAAYRGRGPVALPAPASAAAGVVSRRPRVVVLDTGIGAHPWFPAGTIRHEIEFADGTRWPSEGLVSRADTTAMVPNRMLGALGTHTGHGTFIAGLLRQVCPAADIVALPVMGADGVVPESVLTSALRAVRDRQREQPGWADAVVLSLGYYSEDGEDLVYTSHLRAVLLDLARLGIATFCAAGNDATSRPSFPAAFAVDPEFTAGEVVPLVSVAALNPDGTVAAFSNDGRWVTAETAGVNLVSTAPVGADGATRSAVSAIGVAGRVRSQADPDDFVSGFASWSGTSFAAPVLAGRYLTRLRDHGFPAGNAERAALLPLGRSGR